MKQLEFNSAKDYMLVDRTKVAARPGNSQTQKLKVEFARTSRVLLCCFHKQPVEKKDLGLSD